jgi:hypothetical protein
MPLTPDTKLGKLKRRGLAPSGGAAAAFSPSDVSGLQLWMQPSNISAFADAAAINTFSASVGGTISQATGASQPTAQTNELNGLAVIRFDGSDTLVTTVVATQKPCTRFAVVKATDYADDRTMFGSTANGGLQWRLDVTDGHSHLVQQGTADIAEATGGPTAATWTILAVTYSNIGAAAFYLAGVADGTATQDRTLGASNILLGNNSAAGEAFLGDIAEVMQYDSVLSTTNLNNVGNYLKAKYGLTWTGL